MKNIILDEPFFIFDFTKNEWVPKKGLKFTYDHLDESYKDVPILREFGEPGVILESLPMMELDEKYPINPINHLYEIHHYDHKSFLKSSFMKKRNPMPRHTPKHVLSLTLELEELEDHIFFYAKDKSMKENFRLFIGCNLKAKNSNEKWKNFKAELYKQFRYSHQAIFDQMYIRFTQLIIKSFKAILRYFLKFNDPNLEAGLFTSFQIFSYFKDFGIRKAHFEKYFDITSEFKNIVYKCLISEGIFPVYVDLNTMNENVVSQIFQWIFEKRAGLKEAILPWSPKFHAAATILDRYYSYTPNNHVNQRFEKDRILAEKWRYFRIKILDFFPLDDWIIKIAKFLSHNFDSFLDEISFKSFIKDFSRKSQIIKPINNNLGRDERAPQMILEPLLDYVSRTDQDQNKSIWIKYEKYKINKKKEKRKVYAFLVDVINTRSESVLEKKNTLPQYLAEAFLDNYRFELKKKSNFLDKFCDLIAETEFSEYSSIDLNCQTVVSRFVLDIYDQFKRYVDILLPMPFPDDPCQQEFLRMNYLRFESVITNDRFFEKNTFIQPTYFTARLDYYGIYVDTDLEIRIESLTEETKKERSKPQNIKIKDLQNDFKRQFFNLFTPKEVEDIQNRRNENPNFAKMKSESSISKCLSSLMFNALTEILENRKEIIWYKVNNGSNEKNELKRLNNEKYQLRDLSREFSYYYFNSIRYHNAVNERENFFSYIGFVIIKDPRQTIKEAPQNFSKNYDLF